MSISMLLYEQTGFYPGIDTHFNKVLIHKQQERETGNSGPFIQGVVCFTACFATTSTSSFSSEGALGFIFKETRKKSPVFLASKWKRRVAAQCGHQGSVQYPFALSVPLWCSGLIAQHWLPVLLSPYMVTSWLMTSLTVTSIFTISMYISLTGSQSRPLVCWASPLSLIIWMRQAFESPE